MGPRQPTCRPAAVIFDMDGLMLDTEPLAARAWSVAAAELGLAFDGAVTSRLVGRNFSDCRDLLVAHHGDDYPVDLLMRTWHVAYDAIVEVEGIALKPGLIELLAWLDAERIDKAVATSTRRSRAQAKLAKTALSERFAVLVGGDEIERGKPAPDIFVLAAARLAAEPAACIVLEDSEPGVRGALAAGMTPIVVPDRAAPSIANAATSLLVLPTLHDVRLHLAALPAG
jgi:HAD superfamily hydrolase (TIGR01509 family)